MRQSLSRPGTQNRLRPDTDLDHRLVRLGTHDRTRSHSGVDPATGARMSRTVFVAALVTILSAATACTSAAAGHASSATPGRTGAGHGSSAAPHARKSATAEPAAAFAVDPQV